MMTTFFFPSLDALSSLGKSDDDVDSDLDSEGVKSVTLDDVTLGVMLVIVTFLASVVDREIIERVTEKTVMMTQGIECFLGDEDVLLTKVDKEILFDMLTT